MYWVMNIAGRGFRGIKNSTRVQLRMYALFGISVSLSPVPSVSGLGTLEC